MSYSTRVVKYGGSSLASTAHIDFVARQILQQKQPGESLVVVASAMGDTTDELMHLAGEVSGNPPIRELDKLLSTGECASTALLAMALQRLGHDAVSLTGAQSGIHTSDEHFNASIEHVDARRIRDELRAGRIVVAAGFQGCNARGEITTLGLGGSDTTAVVLAAALNARRAEICSDVDGVYSADPRVVKQARRIDEISYDEMLEMARHGASVLNPCAVEHARHHGVEIYSRHTRRPGTPGTLIHDLKPGTPRVVGVASHETVLPLSIRGDAKSAVADDVLAHIDDDHVFVEHFDPGTGRRNILIPAERLPDPQSFTDELEDRFEQHLSVGPRRSSVSAIGLGVGEAGHIQTTSRRYSRQAGVDLHGDYALQHSVTCVVSPKQAPKLMNVFHREFECPGEVAA